MIVIIMKELREIIRAIISDDALYRRNDIPGDVDDPVVPSCGCSDVCSCNSDYETPKYALFNMIGNAIKIYDAMPGEETGDQARDREIVNISKSIKRLSS